MNTIELFAGAGGLALGLAKAGFNHRLLVDNDPFTIETLLENQRRGQPETADWRIEEADVGAVDFRNFSEIDLVAAGVPCQPFSIGGKHDGHSDRRNMFPVVVDLVRELAPKAILIENVRGLARPSFAKYLEYVQVMLALPECRKRKGERWFDHLHRLKTERLRWHTGLRYSVVSQVVNAADYGVPQIRHRMFIIAFRSDLEVSWNFPLPTHSLESLMWSQFHTSDYRKRHGLGVREPLAVPVYLKKIARRVGELDRSSLLPWRTVRDVLLNLPKASNRREDEEPSLTHYIVGGARIYSGHCGSVLDHPAKTLKAGIHGVPGGENMLRLRNGRRRYFTLREAARLQTFPDNFVFPTSWTSAMRLIGNAVPVALSEQIGASLRLALAQS